MQLSERELLSIDDNINIHLPFEIHYPNKEKQPITILHLLTHRSSIIDGKYYDDAYTTDLLYAPLSIWLENYLHKNGDAYATANFSEHGPGENSSYSNIGFGLLALIVENVSGIPFESYCQQQIFSPLEMTHTAWKYPKTKHDNATPYAFFSKKSQADQISKLLETNSIRINTYLPITPYQFPNYPDGLLFSSVQDLSKFAQCILRNGNFNNQQILSAKSIDRMFEIQGDTEDKQGLCWQYTGFGNIWGHGGDDPGVKTGLFLDRKNDRAMIMIKNSNLGNRVKIMKDLYQASMNKNN